MPRSTPASLVVAEREDDLHIVCYEVNARGNKIQALAGENNVMSAMDKHAKQLTFMQPAKKVDEIFSRPETFFFPGPHHDDWGNTKSNFNPRGRGRCRDQRQQVWRWRRGQRGRPQCRPSRERSGQSS
ncbi:hypothetical protein AHAS_Ahas12G0058600 [Arachis hypogaea]